MFLVGAIAGFTVGAMVSYWILNHELEDCKIEVEMNELRESAKAKLTPEEIEAFGLYE